MNFTYFENDVFEFHLSSTLVRQFSYKGTKGVTQAWRQPHSYKY